MANQIRRAINKLDYDYNKKTESQLLDVLNLIDEWTNTAFISYDRPALAVEIDKFFVANLEYNKMPNTKYQFNDIFTFDVCVKLLNIITEKKLFLPRTFGMLLQSEYVCDTLKEINFVITDEYLEFIHNGRYINNISKLTFDVSQRAFDDYTRTGLINIVDISNTICDSHCNISNPEVVSHLIDNNKTPLQMRNDNLMFFAAYGTITHLKKAILYGNTLDKKCLYAACLSQIDTEKKLQLIIAGGIQLDSECFKIILNNNNTTKRSYFYRKVMSRVCPELIMLLNLGYTLTYNDVLLALRKKIIFPDIHKYNFTFDSQYYDICTEIGQFPYGLCIATPDISVLVAECGKSGNLKVIRELCTKYNLQPTADCLFEACKVRGNHATIEYLLAKGAKPSFTCLERIARLGCGRATLSMIKALEQHVAANGTSVDEPTNKETNEPIDDDEVVIMNDFGDSPINNTQYEPTDIASEIPIDNALNDIHNDDNNAYGDIKYENIANEIIPVDFDCKMSIYNNIPNEIRKLILTKANKNLKFVNFLKFKELMLNYLKMVAAFDTNYIRLQEPYLYKGSFLIKIKDINSWAYCLLDFTAREEVKQLAKKVKRTAKK